MKTIRKPQRLGWGDRIGHGSSFSKPNYNMKSPVYRGDGKVIGYILNGTLHKSVCSEKHMLQKPKGWAWDVDVLFEAEKDGVSQIEIQDRKSGETYHVSIHDYWEYGIGFNRGWGDQIVLPLKYWQVSGIGEPHQTKLPF